LTAGNGAATLPDRVDGVFVGGGHNSLVCAAYLARAGLKVLVLEAAPRIGGAPPPTR
jgi:phytoene dehydrogenase-like protein